MPQLPGDDAASDRIEDLAAAVDAKRQEFGISVDPASSESFLAQAIARIEEREASQPVAPVVNERQARINEYWTSFVRARGERYKDCRLGNYRATTGGQKDAIAKLLDFAENVSDRIRDGVNIILLGPPGTGKDHLLAAMCRAAILADQSVEWVNGTSLWMRFRKAIGEETPEEVIARRLTVPRVLAISDPMPPRGPLTDYQAAMLFEVIDTRYNNRRPTWVTINAQNREEAESRMGWQVVDRLGHDALAIPCNWDSFRKG
jgi:DNA replication protein DnaC